MTIQSILAQYPKVKAAIDKFIDDEDIDTQVELDALGGVFDQSFNTLEGHSRAFFRGQGVYIIVQNVYMVVADRETFVGHCGRVSTNEIRSLRTETGSTEVEPYDTAFLSAFDTACKYLEPKL